MFILFCFLLNIYLEPLFQYYFNNISIIIEILVHTSISMALTKEKYKLEIKSQLRYSPPLIITCVCYIFFVELLSSKSNHCVLLIKSKKMKNSSILWIGFNVFVLLMLALDLSVFYLLRLIIFRLYWQLPPIHLLCKPLTCLQLWDSGHYILHWRVH